jgi:transcriptional regulator with XRE-family HTH domain
MDNLTPAIALVADDLIQSQAEALGSFLRARRESLDPVRMGLPRTGRRRTPGLRREDVAALANIGLTWYTKLEQGRPVRASAKVLSAIAEALQCSEAETRHVFNLAGMPQPGRQAQSCERLSYANQVILDCLDPVPAIVQNARFDILGFNQAYCRLVNVALDQVAREDRNCIFLALTNPAWRASLADWDDLLPRLVALFRASMAEHQQDPQWTQQLQRYQSVSEEFRQAWQRNEVRAIENQVKRFRHPQYGILNLQQTNWWSAPRHGDRLLVYVPMDPASEQALQGMAARELVGPDAA